MTTVRTVRFLVDVVFFILIDVACCFINVIAEVRIADLCFISGNVMFIYVNDCINSLFFNSIPK